MMGRPRAHRHHGTPKILGTGVPPQVPVRLTRHGRFTEPLEQHGLLGLRLIVDCEHAKLASHFGQHDEAARLARRALPMIDAYPRPTAAANELRTLAQGHPTATGGGGTQASLDQT